MPAITLEITKAKKLHAQEDYFNFGEALGEIVVIATTPIPAEGEETWSIHNLF